MDNIYHYLSTTFRYFLSWCPNVQHALSLREEIGYSNTLIVSFMPVGDIEIQSRSYKQPF